MSREKLNDSVLSTLAVLGIGGFSMMLVLVMIKPEVRSHEILYIIEKVVDFIQFLLILLVVHTVVRMERRSLATEEGKKEKKGEEG